MKQFIFICLLSLFSYSPIWAASKTVEGAKEDLQTVKTELRHQLEKVDAEIKELEEKAKAEGKKIREESLADLRRSRERIAQDIEKLKDDGKQSWRKAKNKIADAVDAFAKKVHKTLKD